MIGLVDFDSVLYKAVYRVVSFGEMRRAIENYGKENAKQWLLETVYNEGLNRAENIMLEIQNHLESIFFESIDSWEIFITTSTKNFRYEIDANYKSNRKKNNYVWLLREHYRNNGAICSEVLEADDLIANRVSDLKKGEYIIISIDKDLKQLGGYYWSYYKQKSKDFNGDLVLNEFGNAETEYKQKEVEFISEDEAKKFFYTQMLVGDASDNIKGLKGIGFKRAEYLLMDSKNYFITTARAYIEKSTKEDFRKNYNLIKLGRVLTF